MQHSYNTVPRSDIEKMQPPEARQFILDTLVHITHLAATIEWAGPIYNKNWHLLAPSREVGKIVKNSLRSRSLVEEVKL